MINYNDLKYRVLNLNSDEEFKELALDIFNFQFENNKVYREFCHYLNVNTSKVDNLKAIPFLPIEFFKSHHVISNDKPIETTFTSSGTTGMKRSHH